MFTVDCTTHGKPVLLTERRITRLENSLNGIRVHWRCWCGNRGEFLTGRQAHQSAQLSSALR